MMSDEVQGSTSKLNFGAAGAAAPAADATPVAAEQTPVVEAAPTEEEVKAATIQNEVDNGQQTAPAPIAEAAADAVVKAAGIDENPVVDIKAPTPVTATEDTAALLAQKQALEDRIAESRKAELTSVIAQIKTVVDQYKVPVADLVEALGGLKKTRKSSGTVKPKYQNPDNKDQTWTGRGKAPLWIKDKDKTKFLIA